MNTTIIQCQNLSYAYSGKMALSNVSFAASAGEPIGLVGPNGAGKSTLLSILSGFLMFTAGTVTLFGQQPGKAEFAGRVSALPQDARLDPAFTIGDQLGFLARLQGFTNKQARTEVNRVLDAVDMKESLHDKPGTLSHGMAKRVAIAQALIGKPELILLDEPTAGLDPVNTRNIRSIITGLSPEMTFIISSHNLDELGRLCRQILLLENGMMNTMQLDDTQTESATRFYTLQMEPCQSAEVIAKLRQLADVVSVTNPQKHEFIVEYASASDARMDLNIINCLADNQWQYRQLSQGKSLEEKLFFND